MTSPLTTRADGIYRESSRSSVLVDVYWSWMGVSLTVRRLQPLI